MTSSKKGRKRQIEQYTKAALDSGTEGLWYFYRNLLQGPLSFVLPEHTRDALFQLFCDLRTNVPKDQRWAYQRGSALKPKTFPGWIALGSFACGVAALSALVSSALIVTGLGLAAVASGFLLVIGAIAGFWLMVISGLLFASTFFFAWLATFAAAGYAGLSMILLVIKSSQQGWQRLTEPAGKSRPNSLKQASHNDADESLQMHSVPSTSSELLDKPPGLTQSSDASNFSSEGFKNGKRTFAEVQQSSQESTQFPGQPIETSVQSQQIESSIPKPVKTYESEEGSNPTGGPPDLSPGRLFEQPLNDTGVSFTDAKGPLGQIFTPEGGPTVAGKFAEAVHPDALTTTQVNGDNVNPSLVSIG